MAEWVVKSGTNDEHEIWTKDGRNFRRINGYKYSEWLVTTSDDCVPNINTNNRPIEGDAFCGVKALELDCVNMLEINGANIESVQIICAEHGFTCFFEWRDVEDEAERKEIENAWEEGAYEGLAKIGWISYDSEHWIWGEVKIEEYEQQS